MKKKLQMAVYRVVKALVRLFYPKIEAVGAENLPDESALIVGNHCQMNGPIVCELYFPKDRVTWCAGEMMHLKEVPAYAYQDFWSGKRWYCRWFFKLASYLIAPLSVCVFNSAQTIGVFHDSRVISTFKATVRTLAAGQSVVIFPEHDEPHNHIIRDFQDKFIDIAKLYYKRTGKAVAFVPMYIAPKLKKMYFGKPITFCPENSIEEERRRICEYLMEEITSMAVSLPRHTVVPYKNIPGEKYPTNIP